MQSYIIRRACAPLPGLTGAIFDPAAEPFCRGEYAPIDRYAWGGEYRPEARAYLAWDEGGIDVLLCAWEETISARTTEFGGDVWKDSCLEWFLRPFEDDPRYINIETNAAGAALIAVGPDREHRQRLSACPTGMDIRASRHAGSWWAVAYRLPFDLIGALFGRRPEAGMAFFGNFYKCDESLHPHFGSWNPIEAPAPDFHRPECFGKLMLEA